MKARTFKRVSKRFISSLLSIMMILSLFTVCAVGSTITASAFDASNATVTVDASATNWTSVYLYIGKGDAVSIYEMTKSGNYYTKTGLNWGGYTGYFFADSGSYSIANSDKLWETYKAIADGSKSIDPGNSNNDGSNPYWSALSTSTITITTKGSSGGGGDDDDDNTDEDAGKDNSYWIPATLFNYRTTDQISAASSVTEDTLKKSFNIDKTNGMATPWNSWRNGTYSTYNHAVSDWFNGTGAATPLYQGNFHDQVNLNGYGSDTPSYYHFMLVANGANRSSGNTGSSTYAVAQGLVDDTLNANGNITQGKKEMPQFSKSFMETANEDDVIQTVYENLLFEAVATKKSNGNVWYSYDSANDGNRSLNVATSKIRGVDSNGNGHYDTVYSCTSTGGQGSAGYFPFNESTPTNRSNIVNSFGNRFDVTFTMTENGTLNGEDLQFSFTGDDDLWVYIDGYLALDMGGTHNKASGNFNLNTSKMYSQVTSGYYSGKYSSSKYNYAAVDWTDDDAKVALDTRIVESLKDTTKEHTMTIFYMERGMFDSNLSFEFMLPQSNSLTINQELDTTNVNDGFVDETINMAERDVHEVVLSSNSTSATKNPTAKMPITKQFDRANYDGTTTTLQQVVAASQVTKPTGSFTNSGTDFATAAGTTFIWTDTNKSKDGTTASSGSGVGVVASNGGVDLLYNQSAVFNDQFVVNSTIQLVPQDALKTFVSGYVSPGGPANAIASGRLASDYYDSDLDLRNNGNNKVTISDDGKFSFGSATSSGEKITATYTNTVKTGTVQFTKKLAQGEAEDNNTVFYFTIDFANVFGGSNSDFNKYNVIYKIKDTDNTISSGQQYALKTNGIELKVGQTAIIEGVPVGTRYRILETGTSNDSKGYAVANITAGTDNKDAAYVDSTPLSNGVEATVAKALTGADNVTHLDFNNTTKATTVLYRFYDRYLEKGLPTSMETHYTYFTREMPGTLTGTEADIDTIINYAPTIVNPLKEYSIIEDDKNNIHSIEFNHVLTDDDLDNAEGLPSEYVAGKTVHLVTYFDSDRLYTVEYECRDDNGNTISGTVQPPEDPNNPGQRLKGYPFNSLIELNKLRTAKTYQDEQGEEREFRYWALKTSNGKGGTVYTPVSSNFCYSYRVTSSIVLKAVYENDEGYTQLPAPICITGKGYNVTGLGSGHDAAATEKVYDSYSKDLPDGTTQDRTRINVMFSSVGSEDTDRNITYMGYILLYNKDGYATDELFTDDHLLNQIKDAGNYNNMKNITDVNGKSYPVQVRAYEVENHMTLTPSIDGSGNVTSWTPSEYISQKVALTNKNRANLVFDLAQTEANKEKYYTCYTIMTRYDVRYDSEGKPVVDENNMTIFDRYNYVSDTPVYFNLNEAPPYQDNVEEEDNSYEVKTHVVDQNGNADPSAGTVTPSTTFIKDNSLLTITVHQSDYVKAGVTMKSTLKSLKVGNKLIEEDKFAECGLTATGTSAYTFLFNNTYLEDGADTLEVTATFNVVEDTTEVIVDPTTVTCTNGSIQLSNDNGTTFVTSAIKVKKGTSFKVKAVPASGYALTGWSNNTYGTSEIITINVDANGNFTIPTPTFTEKTVETYTVYIANKTGWSGNVYYTTSAQSTWTAMTKLDKQYQENTSSNHYDLYSVQVTSDITWIKFADGDSGSGSVDVTFSDSNKLVNGTVFEIRDSAVEGTSSFTNWSEYNAPSGVTVRFIANTSGWSAKYYDSVVKLRYNSGSGWTEKEMTCTSKGDNQSIFEVTFAETEIANNVDNVGFNVIRVDGDNDMNSKNGGDAYIGASRQNNETLYVITRATDGTLSITKS